MEKEKAEIMEQSKLPPIEVKKEDFEIDSEDDPNRSCCLRFLDSFKPRKPGPNGEVELNR
jgi:hypothetical protein